MHDIDPINHMIDLGMRPVDPEVAQEIANREKKYVHFFTTTLGVPLKAAPDGWPRWEDAQDAFYNSAFQADGIDVEMTKEARDDLFKSIQEHLKEEGEEGATSP